VKLVFGFSVSTFLNVNCAQGKKGSFLENASDLMSVVSLFCKPLIRLKQVMTIFAMKFFRRTVSHQTEARELSHLCMRFQSANGVGYQIPEDEHSDFHSLRPTDGRALHDVMQCATYNHRNN
jgi:hypothetical protein